MDPAPPRLLIPKPLRPGVTACVAAHPARFANGKLSRALGSVLAQTRQPDAIVVCNDRDRLGAGPNRQNILDQVTTEWMAWCDSDDEWFPQHLERLLAVAQETGAWFVFSYPVGDGLPFDHFGIPFNPATPYHTTITFMVKTALARRVGFPVWDPPAAGFSNEDWAHITGMCVIMAEEGIPAVAVAERTWRYHIDGGNSSGLPGQGDAA